MRNTAEIAISYPLIDEREFSTVMDIMRGHIDRNQANGNVFHQILASGILTYSLLQQFEIHNEDKKLLEDAEKYAYSFADKLTHDHPLFYNTVIDRLRVAVAKNNQSDAELYYNMIVSQESHGVKPTHVADARRAIEKLEINPSSFAKNGLSI